MNPRSDGGASEKEKLTRMDLLGTQRAQSIMLLIVTTILIGTVLDVAQAVLAPALFALVVGIVVSPLADRLDRAGVPRIVVASSLLIAATALLFSCLDRTRAAGDGDGERVASGSGSRSDASSKAPRASSAASRR